MKLLLSLSSRKLRGGNGKINPKNYPFGDKLINLLRQEGIVTVQARTSEDIELSVDETYSDLNLKELKKVIEECDTFISVDNFIQHYATYLGKRGIVIFSRSDPLIFGYPQNINLLKNRSYLRPNQFGTWEEDNFVGDAFVEPEVVLAEVNRIKRFRTL